MSLIFEIDWNPERMVTEVFKIRKGDRKGREGCRLENRADSLSTLETSQENALNSVVFEREKEEKKERMEGKSLKSRESGFETLIN